MPEPSAANPADARARRFGPKLAAVFLLITAMLGIGGYLYLTRQQVHARITAHRELSAIADLKLRQISNWREERLSDARLFSRVGFVAEDVKRFLDEPDSEAARTAVSQWLTLLKTKERYDAAVAFDMRLKRRLAIPPSADEPAASVGRLLERALQTHDVAFGDLHRDETNGPIHLDIALPIFEGADPKRGTPIAAVLLKMDAQRFLFPLIQSWPTPSQSAETLLVRREGDEVLYLNDLRHQAGTAFVLRRPLASAGLPAARILQGETRVLEGVDYRGMPVVAAGRLIPGTSWAMVAKMDQKEIYAPLRRQFLPAMSALGASLIASALLLLLLCQRHSARFLERELAEREAHKQSMERMNRLYAALSQVNLAVVRAGSRDELLQEICRALVQHGGFQMAWVGWVDQTSSRVVPLAHVGDDNGYLQEAKVFADDRPEGRGPVGTAIREGRPCVCTDFFSDPNLLPWREAAARSGWRSLAAFPIRQEDHIQGALAVYARQKDFFGAREQALVQEAATDVGFGLDTLLNDQRRKQAENSVRQARDELARANADLEQKVGERTAQLVEANANLQTFAYTAAHDLRSPLRAIKGFSRMVLEDGGAGLDASNRSMLERVTVSAEQMGRLLDDLLDYSKISEAEVKLEPVDLGKTVEEALTLLDTDIRGKNAVVTVGKPLPGVIGHSATVVLLVNNLVSNALKFMPPGVQPQIQISAELTDGRVRLSVQDNGIGIGQGDLGKIFGAFHRLHGNQAYPGTGLGLAIVRKGAERMGGRVGVESDPGRGSRFWVELKAANESASG